MLFTTMMLDFGEIFELLERCPKGAEITRQIVQLVSRGDEFVQWNTQDVLTATTVVHVLIQHAIFDHPDPTRIAQESSMLPSKQDFGNIISDMISPTCQVIVCMIRACVTWNTLVHPGELMCNAKESLCETHYALCRLIRDIIYSCAFSSENVRWTLHRLVRLAKNAGFTDPIRRALIMAELMLESYSYPEIRNAVRGDQFIKFKLCDIDLSFDVTHGTFTVCTKVDYNIVRASPPPITLYRKKPTKASKNKAVVKTRKHHTSGETKKHYTRRSVKSFD